MSATGFDPRRFKALERAGFNRIAARYAAGAHLRAELADAVLDAAALAPGLRVLDLASGPGLLAHPAATRTAPTGWVIATDIAEAMLAHARDTDGSGRISFAAADAENLCLPDGCVDRVLAGLALFMFPHPERALAEIRRVLRPGGRAVLSVWGTRASVPLIARAQDCIARLLPAPKVARPSVFRFGEPDVLTAMLTTAGFSEIAIGNCRFSCHFEQATDYWQAFLDLAGGAAESLSRLPESKLSQLRDAIAAELEQHRNPDGPGYRVDASALVAVAQRP